MRRMMGIALCGVLGLIATGWAASRSDRPADALTPDNDRTAQLERRIAELEARLRAVEQKLPPTWTVPANHLTPAVPPPQPLPQPGEGEINGVKFRVFPLSSERAAPVRR
jgi:hypothetical protein